MITHINKKNNPTIVDITKKKQTNTCDKQTNGKKREREEKEGGEEK